jgi:hypothetical protein
MLRSTLRATCPIALVVVIAAATPFEAIPDDGAWEAWWADLEGREADATRALLKMSARPNEAVTFLKARMKPLKIEPDAVRALLAKLASEDEKIWKPAFEELEYLDPRLAIDLEDLMNEVTEAPARQRMVEVLSGRPAGSLEDKTVDIRRLGQGDGFNFFSENGSWWAEHVVARINHNTFASTKKKWTRAVRAIVLLEHLGTPEAIAILKDMTSGHASAQPTNAAKESLRRIREGQSVPSNLSNP